MPGFGPALQFKDGFGNVVQLVTINAPHQELVIEAGGTVETADCSGVVAGLPNTSPAACFCGRPRTPSPMPPSASLPPRPAARTCWTSCTRWPASCATASSTWSAVTDAHTSAAEALADGKGVCQDHAHIFISAARTLGVPARYVTGYLVLGEQSRSDAHHAWAEAWVDGLGWVGFDVANRICPTERYVRLAVGLDAGGAAPVVGSRRGGQHEALDVAVDVQQQSAQQ